jgi:hypothetical protein
MLKVYEEESEEAAQHLEEAQQNLRRVEVEVDNLGRFGPYICNPSTQGVESKININKTKTTPQFTLRTRNS